MADINYTWLVLETDQAGKSMIVEYSAQGLKTYTIGMPLPTPGISLSERIAQYAPIPNWEFDSIIPIPVETGTTGTNTVTLNQSSSLSDFIISQLPS